MLSAFFHSCTHEHLFIPGCSFCACDRLLGIDLSEDEAEEEFEIIDENGGGVVLFDEFCKWLAHRQEAQMRLGRVERPAARQQQQAQQHTRPSSQQAERQPHPQQPGVNAAGMQTALAPTAAAAAAAPAPAASEVEARLRAEFEAEMLSQRQTSPAAAHPAAPPLAKTSKPRELYYAVSMNQPHTRATVAEFSARCLSGEVSRHAVMIWTSGMDSWSLPDDPVARQAIPELAELLPDV